MNSMAGPVPEHSEEIEQLAALYALNALADEDLALFEAHLAECAECRQLVAQDRQTASYLSLVAAEDEPSPSLRARLLAAAEADIAPRIAGEHRPGRTSGLTWVRRLFARLAVPAVVACLALLLGVVLGYRLALGQVLHSVPMEGPGGPGSEVVIHRSGDVDVELRGLPDPPSGELYVVWLEEPTGRFEPLGSYDDGNGTCPLDRPVLGGRLILTIEPAAIPAAPTSAPVLWATIS